MVAAMANGDAPGTITPNAARRALRRQYLAALSMLRDALRRCPDELWDDPRPTVSCRELACDAAFLTRYHLFHSQAAFRPWPGFDGDAPLGVDDSRRHTQGAAPESTGTSRAEVVAYVEHVIASLDASLAAIDLAASESGFHGYRMSKLEHQLLTLRHLQHHTAQLVDRVRAATGDTAPWIVSDRSDEVN